MESIAPRTTSDPPRGSFSDGEEDGEKKKTKEEKKKSKRYKLDKDGFPSVFGDEDWRHKLFEHLPLVKVKKLKKNPKILNTIAGPYDIQFPFKVFEPLICGRSISTYPYIPGKPNRDGDPICDSYCVQLLEEDVVIALVCDGCNWGRRPMEASNAAKSAFVEYLRNHQSEIEELRDAGHYLLQALSYSHFKICEGKEDIWEAGTTTLLGGMLFRIKKSKEEVKAEGKEKESFKWVWVCVSIGDCKAFHYTAATKQVRDITEGNRRSVYDAKDPGGRLGPYVGDGEPDIRNVSVYYTLCEENDILLILSDGVHDNLDPMVLGKLPKDSGPQYSQVTNWRGFKSDEEVVQAKTLFMKKFLIDELILGGETDEKLRSKVFSHATQDEPLSPTSITSRIMKHCLAVTGKGREWMEQNPRERLPEDYVAYPGKMDHATAVVLRVAKFEKELAKASLKNSPTNNSERSRRQSVEETAPKKT